MWDRAALSMLRRAVSARGRWAGTVLRDPTPEQRQVLMDVWGIDPLGRDNAGAGQARTRWARAFVRAVHYHAGRPVQVEIGRHKPAVGRIPAGRAVRVRTRIRGDAAMRAVRRLPDSARIYDDAGDPAGRWADPADRDWQ